MHMPQARYLLNNNAIRRSLLVGVSLSFFIPSFFCQDVSSYSSYIKSISKSLLSQLSIHIILTKQEKIASNSLSKQLDINSNLANLSSARVNIRARIRLGIRSSSFLSGALHSLSGPLRFVNGFFYFTKSKMSNS